MAKRDFASLYYQVANTLTSDTVFDGAPATRILGADSAPGFSTVFTALGSRFDVAYVAEEAFSGADDYESDVRAVDGVPVADALRYVRGQAVVQGALTPAQGSLAERARRGLPAYSGFHEAHAGDEAADLVFLASPAHADAEGACARFIELARRAGVPAFATNSFGDVGALALALDLEDAADDAADGLRRGLETYGTVVTDDAHVLDALLVLVPEYADRVRFIDAFAAEHAVALGAAGASGRIAVHESGLLARLYPLDAVDYADLFPAAQVLLPARRGADATGSGLAGGLGLANGDSWRALAKRRLLDLEALGADVIVAPDAAEARALEEAGGARVLSLADYLAGLS